MQAGQLGILSPFFQDACLKLIQGVLLSTCAAEPSQDGQLHFHAAQVFVGVGASRVRDMFKKARSSAPCILFIDEFDGIGQQRSSSAMGNDGARRLWAQPLAFMVMRDS